MTAVVSLAFVYYGVIKLIGLEIVVVNFKKWSIPDVMRYPLGILEIAGAIGLWVPGLRKWAALGLMGMMLGAIYTHVKVADPIVDTVPAVVMFLLAGAVYLFRR